MSQHFQVNWDSETLRTERLDWKHNPADFERLCEYVVSRLARDVIAPGELMEITTPEELRHHVREAAERYSPEKFGNIGFYSYNRLKFLVFKWRRQHNTASQKTDDRRQH